MIKNTIKVLCFISFLILFTFFFSFNSAEAGVYSSNGKYGYKGNYSTGYKGYWLDFSKEHDFKIPAMYDEIELLEECFRDTYLLVTKGNKKSVINRHNRTVFPFGKYKDAEKVQGWAGLNYVKVTAHNGKYGAYLCDRYIVPAKFDSIKFYPCVVVVGSNKKFGVYDFNGELIIPVIYDNIYPEDLESNINRLVMVKNKKYGIYDIYAVNHTILPFEFDYIDTETKVVQKGNLYGKYSDNYMIRVLPVEYSKIELLDKENSVFKIVKNNKAGLLYNDNIICDTIYDDIKQVNFFEFEITKNKKHGIIKYDFSTEKFKELVPLE